MKIITVNNECFNLKSIESVESPYFNSLDTISVTEENILLPEHYIDFNKTRLVNSI